MSSAGGYNPMRYDCEERGCYNKALRPTDRNLQLSAFPDVRLQ